MGARPPDHPLRRVSIWNQDTARFHTTTCVNRA